MLLKKQSLRFLENIRIDNTVHHLNPTLMVKYTYWENINTSVMMAVPVSIVVFTIGAPTWVWLGVLFSSLANLVHRFAHTSRAQCPLWIRVLQYTGLFISPNMHNPHHFRRGRVIMKEDTRNNYCVMTNWLNPLLDLVSFFDVLEFVSGFCHQSGRSILGGLVRLWSWSRGLLSKHSCRNRRPGRW